MVWVASRRTLKLQPYLYLDSLKEKRNRTSYDYNYWRKYRLNAWKPLYICCFIQIRSHDRQCCPDCYWNLAWERCSGALGKMPPVRHVWQVFHQLGTLSLTSWWFLNVFFLISFVLLSIATLAVAQNMRELYRLVLVDTPLAPYFSECITSEV